ncbi:hypothetical protein [Bremerella sp.]|uniref:hypothetical protein n=1 Tax=Bremerella sp. TaxID=2795602 RepID=UPI003918A5DC
MPVFWFVIFVTVLTCIAIHFSCAIYIVGILDDNRELGEIEFFSPWQNHFLKVFIAGWRHTHKPGVRWVMRVWSVALILPVLVGLVLSFLY